MGFCSTGIKTLEHKAIKEAAALYAQVAGLAMQPKHPQAHLMLA
jgi:hypothetical protein